MTVHNVIPISRVDHRHALADYLAMGLRRSLSGLHRRYSETTPNPPSIDTLKYWSRTHAWQVQATEHDAKVAAGVQEHVARAAVEDGWDRVQALADFARRSLEKASEALEGEGMKAGTPGEVKALADAAIAAIKEVDLLTGGPSARVESTQFVTDHCPAWLKARLEESATWIESVSQKG